MGVGIGASIGDMVGERVAVAGIAAVCVNWVTKVVADWVDIALTSTSVDVAGLQLVIKMKRTIQKERFRVNDRLFIEFLQRLAISICPF